MNFNLDSASNLHALVGLWQQEEHRLREIVADRLTSAPVREQASERLGAVLKEIQAASDELPTTAASLKSDQASGHHDEGEQR